MNRFRLTGYAWANLRDIYRFTKERWSEQQADKYVTGLFAQFALIADGRSRGRPLTEFQVKGSRTRYRSHHIFWQRLPSETVAIRAVLHQHMSQSDRVLAAFVEAASPD